MAQSKAHGMVIEAGPDDVVAVFDPEGSLIAANPAGHELLAALDTLAGAPSALRRLLGHCGGSELVDAPLGELDPCTLFECERGASELMSLSLTQVERARAALDRVEIERKQRLEHSLTADFIATDEGEVLQCNAEFARLFGFAAADETAGVNLLDLVAEPTHRQTLQEALRDHRSLRRRVASLTSRTGARVQGLVNLRSVTAEDGTVHIEGTIHDRTEEQRLEDRLMHSQRVEAVGRLAGGIAHDFNNLLTVILAYAQLLERSLEPGTVESRRASEIHAAAERAGELTRRLLAFGRRQLMRAQEIDLNDLLVDLRKFIRSLLPNNIELDIIPARGLAAVRADPTMLEQVVLNLAVNARDAMADGGRLTIETENVVLNGTYAESHPWAAPGRYVLMTVSDTGCGMPREVLDHAFEPFYTTKPPGKGSGLGLASTYGIVKQHDGFVHAYSEPGIGTTIKVYLPASARVASAVGTKIRTAVGTGKETIVLAEDEPSVRAVFVQVLEHRGYEVLAGGDGEEAVRLLQKNIDRVRLVLLDVMMPGIGGLGAYHQIRKLAPALPILFTSGYTGDAVRSHLEADEQLEFVPKPCDPDELLRKVRAAIEGKLRDSDRGGRHR